MYLVWCMLNDLIIFITSSRSVGLCHHTTPAEPDSRECRAGKTFCPPSPAWPGPPGPKGEQRDVSLHHDGMDCTVQSQQVKHRICFMITYVVSSKYFVGFNQVCLISVCDYINMLFPLPFRQINLIALSDSKSIWILLICTKTFVISVVLTFVTFICVHSNLSKKIYFFWLFKCIETHSNWW